jgi:DNA segregation ATPase FtsK/SpoIIIE, S-DNA-T family
MPIGSISSVEREIQDGYVRLARSAATVRNCQLHYNGPADSGHADPAGQADQPDLAALTAAHPWTLAAFSHPAWDAYEPDLDNVLPDGLRAGSLGTGLPGTGLPGAGIPALIPFAGHGHLLITEVGSGERERSLLQALTLRLATATRPGTVRFALADPVGQGRHLSAFLRLPAQLRVGSGIAASPDEIENLLTALTRHVVDVTQTRLTNVYDSVEAYNTATTGATVPYHVLVLAGFPADINERSAELLTRLARNGPRAGLYILATLDPRRPLPRGFDLKALTASTPAVSPLITIITANEHGELSWDDPDLTASVIDPDQMPAASRANPWLDAVGAAASSAGRDLPFARIAGSRRWTGVTTDGLDVQIGVDSKGEPQHFSLGARGVHHGLVGGDVRMGKTNLLHVLISQLALRYPPEELELYLLDFKEVEFDAYLTERLPHARAVTSRTDREFGLSMLRRFHEEINRRARLCREARVTDLADYRQETGQVLPRALVIMDEFQVLFSQEDRLAREAGQLLADIAKRGAAFGLHLLLATQSPGGQLTAYLRPVYEQMALRIALGCTQPTVSQAILGEGNDAATRLIRAGDAIYNDRRGEGANPVMRIAALPTRERLALIATIRELAAGREYPPPASFDPDKPADFAAHPACMALTRKFTQNDSWPDPGPTVAAWLGEAVEIKPPTAATFERYARSNLLIVGGEEHGHGLLLATVLSAAIQRSPAAARFIIAEFTRPTSQFHDFFAPARSLPHEVRIAGREGAGAELEALEAELDARLAAPGTAQPELFFLIAGMHRWQELVTENDYGRPSETSLRLARLADKGPDAGIHVVAWADSYATAERALRRAGLNHFGLRAVLRVYSPAESDALLGVTAAASLDDDRALFRDTEWPSEQVEKFKPYSIASLRAVARTVFADPAFADPAFAPAQPESGSPE